MGVGEERGGVTCTHAHVYVRTWGACAQGGGVPVHTPGQDMHHADTSSYFTIPELCTYFDVY